MFMAWVEQVISAQPVSGQLRLGVRTIDSVSDPNSGLPVGLTVLCRGSQYSWAAFVDRVLPVGIPSFLVPVHPRKDPPRAHQRRNQPSRSGGGCVDRRGRILSRARRKRTPRALPAVACALE